MEKESMSHKILPSLLLLFLVGCGGGGSSVPIGTLEISPPSTPPPTTSSTSFNLWNNVDKIQTIDGYIEGANLFIDWNLNGVQDEGEPSANWQGSVSEQVCVEFSDGQCVTYEDAPENFYFFMDRSLVPDGEVLEGMGFANQQEWIDAAFPNGMEFIDDNLPDYTPNCFFKAVKISEVPVGAYDSERGYVQDAYTLFYGLGHAHDSNGYVNITPFTSVIQNTIDSMSMPVDVTACSSDWWFYQQKVVDDVEYMFDQIYYNTGIDKNFFYDDFIAKGDEVKIAQAESIVDHLASVSTIEDIMTDTFTLETLRPYIGMDALNEILTNPIFDSLTFDMLVEEEENDWVKRVFMNGITVNGNQRLLVDGLPVPITYDNILESSQVFAIQNVFNVVQDNLSLDLIDQTVYIDGASVETKYILFHHGFINEVQNGMIVYQLTSEDIKYIITINSSNNLIPYDVSSVVLNEDSNSAVDINSIVQSLPLSWSDIYSLTSYLYSGDSLSLEKQTSDHTILFNYSNVAVECRVLDNATNNLLYYSSGNDSYSLCNSYF